MGGGGGGVKPFSFSEFREFSGWNRFNGGDEGERHRCHSFVVSLWWTTTYFVCESFAAGRGWRKHFFFSDRWKTPLFHSLWNSRCPGDPLLLPPPKFWNISNALHQKPFVCRGVFIYRLATLLPLRLPADSIFGVIVIRIFFFFESSVAKLFFFQKRRKKISSIFFPEWGGGGEASREGRRRVYEAGRLLLSIVLSVCVCVCGWVLSTETHTHTKNLWPPKPSFLLSFSEGG